MNKQRPLRTSPPARRGAVMVFALIALFVASSLIAVLLQTASLSHRQSKREELRAQARLLADAGLARAAAKLRQQSDFTGESWNVPAEQLSQSNTAIVRLNVTRDPKESQRRIVSAVAEFPAGRPNAVKVTHEMAITLAP